MVDKITEKDIEQARASGYAKGLHAGKNRRDDLFKEANRIIAAYSVSLDFLDAVIKAKIMKHLMVSPAIRSEATKGDMSSFIGPLSEEIMDVITAMHEQGDR
jgi:hypothetical protein